jgi:hypothetical protein
MIFLSADFVHSQSGLTGAHLAGVRARGSIEVGSGIKGVSLLIRVRFAPRSGESLVGHPSVERLETELP